mgnify:CR=1 FL=1
MIVDQNDFLARSPFLYAQAFIKTRLALNSAESNFLGKIKIYKIMKISIEKVFPYLLRIDILIWLVHGKEKIKLI